MLFFEEVGKIALVVIFAFGMTYLVDFLQSLREKKFKKTDLFRAKVHKIYGRAYNYYLDRMSFDCEQLAHELAMRDVSEIKKDFEKVNDFYARIKEDEKHARVQ